MAHSVSNIQDLSDRAAMMDLPITLLVSWCASIILARPFGHLQAPTTTVLLQGLQYQSTQLTSKVVHMYEAKQVGQCKNKTEKCSPSSVTAKKLWLRSLTGPLSTCTVDVDVIHVIKTTLASPFCFCILQVTIFNIPSYNLWPRWFLRASVVTPFDTHHCPEQLTKTKHTKHTNKQTYKQTNKKQTNKKTNKPRVKMNAISVEGLCLQSREQWVLCKLAGIAVV